MSEELKVEAGVEACCVCGAGEGGAGGEAEGGAGLSSPEEYDAGAPPLQPPLRAMLLHLSNNKVVPNGRLCPNCIRRTLDAYNFSTALASKGPPPLSEKIRALRKRLHELTQKIDVFIVVGVGGAGGAYSEHDVIMVERGALQACARGDAEAAARAPDSRGAPVYQCSVCPLTFSRISEYRSHCTTHPASAAHSCWTCGARCASAALLRQHCQLCDPGAQSAAAARRGAGAGAAPAQCPAAGCGRRFASPGELRTHAAAHADLCPVCFLQCGSRELKAAHVLQHRRAQHFLCGYRACILRFTTRSDLMAHIRKCHSDTPLPPAAAPPSPPPAAPAPPAPHVPCPHCPRVFGSQAAMKRHARTHQPKKTEPQVCILQDMDWAEGEKVEYLEVETLEELE